MIKKTDLIKYRIEAFKIINSLVDKLKKNNSVLLQFKSQNDEALFDKIKWLIFNEDNIKPAPLDMSWI